MLGGHFLNVTGTYETSAIQNAVQAMPNTSLSQGGVITTGALARHDLPASVTTQATNVALPVYGARAGLANPAGWRPAQVTTL